MRFLVKIIISLLSIILFIAADSTTSATAYDEIMPEKKNTFNNQTQKTTPTVKNETTQTDNINKQISTNEKSTSNTDLFDSSTGATDYNESNKTDDKTQLSQKNDNQPVEDKTADNDTNSPEERTFTEETNQSDSTSGATDYHKKDQITETNYEDDEKDPIEEKPVEKITEVEKEKIVTTQPQKKELEILETPEIVEKKNTLPNLVKKEHKISEDVGDYNFIQKTDDNKIVLNNINNIKEKDNNNKNSNKIIELSTNMTEAVTKEKTKIYKTEEKPEIQKLGKNQYEKKSVKTKEAESNMILFSDKKNIPPTKNLTLETGQYNERENRYKLLNFLPETLEDFYKAIPPYEYDNIGIIKSTGKYIDSQIGKKAFNDGFTALKNDNVNFAIDVFKKTALYHYRVEDSYYYLAICYKKKNKFNLALNYLNKAISIKRDLQDIPYEYLEMLGNIYYEDHKYSKAILTWKEAIESGKNNHLYNKIGLAYYEQNNIERSLYYWKSGMEAGDRESSINYRWLIENLNN